MKSWKGKIIILITAGALAVETVQGMGQGTKTDEFSELPKGRGKGNIFNPKKYVADFGP